jgi:hypothetical protein
MAIVTSALQAATGNSRPTRNVYMVENTINFADHTVDPSAGDVVQAITVPAGSVIMAAGLEVVTALTLDNDADNDVTIDLGTDTEADKYVDGFDADAATAGTYAAADAAAAGPEVHGTANTLDMTFAATSADGISAGKIRVWAVMLDIAEIGDKTANEVDRDLLA